MPPPIDEADLVALLTQPYKGQRYFDDAAIFAPPRRGRLVVSQDMLVEDVDFTLGTFSAEDVGHKALAVNLSDLAAMGSAPLGFVQALAVPKHVSARWLAGYARGQVALAAAHGAALLGGDLSRTAGPLVISITVLGQIAAGRALRRRAARAGDLVCVSGSLGRAAAGLALLDAGRPPPRFAALVKAQRRPAPRVALGRVLARAGGCTSAMDLSDGLASDLPRLLPPGLGATIEVDALPIDERVQEAGRALGRDAAHWALAGGEDFELLCTIAPAAWPRLRRASAAHGGLTMIGRVERRRGLRLARGGVIDTRWPKGFDHFAPEKMT